MAVAEATGTGLTVLRRRLASAKETHGRGSSEALEAFEGLFREAARVGRPLDGLRQFSASERERFFARTVEGTAGHVYWTGWGQFRRNDGKNRRPIRWWWADKAGREPAQGQDVFSVCGEPHCINPEHARLGRSEKRNRFTDEQIIGAVQVAVMQLGHVPSSLEWVESGRHPTKGIVSKRFGGWERAMRVAGFPEYRTVKTPPVRGAKSKER